MPGAKLPRPRDRVNRQFKADRLNQLWVAWFNHHRLLEPIDYIPPAVAEANYWQQHAKAASSTTTGKHVAAQQEAEP